MYTHCQWLWIYLYEAENKCQSCIWVFQYEEKPTKIIRPRKWARRLSQKQSQKQFVWAIEDLFVCLKLRKKLANWRTASKTNEFLKQQKRGRMFTWSSLKVTQLFENGRKFKFKNSISERMFSEKSYRSNKYPRKALSITSFAFVHHFTCLTHEIVF